MFNEFDGMTVSNTALDQIDNTGKFAFDGNNFEPADNGCLCRFAIEMVFKEMACEGVQAAERISQDTFRTDMLKQHDLAAGLDDTL